MALFLLLLAFFGLVWLCAAIVMLPTSASIFFKLFSFRVCVCVVRFMVFRVCKNKRKSVRKAVLQVDVYWYIDFVAVEQINKSNCEQ